MPAALTVFFAFTAFGGSLTPPFDHRYPGFALVWLLGAAATLNWTVQIKKDKCVALGAVVATGICLARAISIMWDWRALPAGTFSFALQATSIWLVVWVGTVTAAFLNMAANKIGEVHQEVGNYE